MTTIRRALSESISHIEDLPIGEFIDALRDLPNMTGQEKLDGANLWLGVDEDSRMFTSREGKRSGADRLYEPDEWSQVSVFDQFRAAHAALQQVEDQIKRIMRPGDTVEVEVLYGRQPNSVTYGAAGKSYIAFLRGVNDTPNEIADHLSQSLKNQQVEAEFKGVVSSDGKEIEVRTLREPFQFTSPQKIDAAELNNPDVNKRLTALEKFLAQSSEIQEMTNMQLAVVSLTSIPKENREAVKAARTELLGMIQTEYKLPIKSALLDKIVRKIRSGLSDDKMSDGEDIGIEGIVLRDANGKQLKIVDKDVFLAINRFNQAARGEVQGALNTTDPEAGLSARGGLLGQMRIDIATILGNRELAKGASARKILEPIKGDTPEEAIKNLAKSINIEDFQQVRMKVLGAVSASAKSLDTKLQEFKDNRDEYRLKLKNGKEMKLSDETVKKTLVWFAEARRNMTQLFDKLKAAKTLPQLLAVMYGSVAKSIHQKESLDEGLILEGGGEFDLSTFSRKDTFHLMNEYLVHVMMAMLIFHVDDKPGMRWLKDHRGYKLKAHSHNMSPLNHWGFVIWRANNPKVVKQIGQKVSTEIRQATKGIPGPWWRYLHMDFSYNKDVKVNWAEHKKTLERLITLAGLRSNRLNSLLDEIVGFPKLTLSGQKRAAKKLNAMALRFTSHSSLYVRTRMIAKKLKDEEQKMGITEGLLREISAITEEGEGGGEAFAGSAVAAQASTSAGAISSLPVKIGDMRRRIEKRKRAPEVKGLTTKFPDPRKANKK